MEFYKRIKYYEFIDESLIKKIELEINLDSENTIIDIIRPNLPIVRPL